MTPFRDRYATRLMTLSVRWQVGLRRVGGFAKPTIRFSECLWADFLRRRIALELVENHFSRAMEEALELANGPQQIICLAGVVPVTGE
jgi:hypothetical protein